MARDHVDKSYSCVVAFTYSTEYSSVRFVLCAGRGRGTNYSSVLAGVLLRPPLCWPLAYVPRLLLFVGQDQRIVHQMRRSPVGGKKTSSILFALHEPMRVPPVILVLPKISPADAVPRTDATTTGASAPKVAGVISAAFGTTRFRKTSRLMWVTQWQEAPMHHFSTMIFDLTASPSARRCISRPDEAALGFGALGALGFGALAGLGFGALGLVVLVVVGAGFALGPALGPAAGDFAKMGAIFLGTASAVSTAGAGVGASVLARFSARSPPGSSRPL